MFLHFPTVSIFCVDMTVALCCTILLLVYSGGHIALLMTSVPLSIPSKIRIPGGRDPPHHSGFFGTGMAMPNGRPCKERIIAGKFQKLRESAGLPKVVFHSLCHSSTTYKLKLNHGDLRATQGDTGHAQIDMITQVYAHILDEDRKVNAQKLEDAFYANANPDLRTVRPPAKTRGPKEPESVSLDLEALVEQLRKSPELANTLAALLASALSGK